MVRTHKGCVTRDCLAPGVDGIETTGTNETPFEDLQHRVLTEAALSPVSSNATHVFLGDRPKLRAACAKLTVEAGNKGLDLVTWRWIQGMLGLLNLHLDEGLMLSWRKASVVVSKAQGHGDTCYGFTWTVLCQTLCSVSKVSAVEEMT